MKRGVTFTSRIAASAGFVGCAAIFVFGLRSLQDSRVKERRQRIAAIESGLSEQIAAMSEFSATKLALLRDEVVNFRVRLGTEETWGQVLRLLGKRWILEGGAQEYKDGYSERHGTFRMVAPTVPDWREILETVKEAEELPGVVVDEFEMKAGGDREHRPINLVRINVTVRARRSGP